MNGQAQPWDRFAGWPRWLARMVLGIALALTILACLVDYSPAALASNADAPAIAARPARDDDLALYDAIIARVRRGEHYYPAALSELRARSYPVRPGFAVRLPTLAVAGAAIGPMGQMIAGLALLGALAFAWRKRLGEEPGGIPIRNIGAALITAGALLLINPEYRVLHEAWAGTLVALSLALHRPGKWGSALVIAAGAIAVRELALPYVLLMAALAGWRRDGREAAAWIALVAIYALLLAWHLSIVAALTGPVDLAGPGWLAWRGFAGFIGNVVLSSPLELLPQWLAGPLVIAMLIGWAGWRSTAAGAAGLFIAGYAQAFMIAGRANNFYWGLMIVPMLAGGLALAPRSIASLWRSAFPRWTHA